MRGDRQQNARACSNNPVFPDQWPNSAEELFRYMDPRYDGPVLDRPHDMQDPPQTLRYGQRIPSMTELQRMLEPELDAGENLPGSVENSSSSVEEAEGGRGARALGGRAERGLAQRGSGARAHARSQSVGPVPTVTEGLEKRAHTRSQSVGLISVPTLTEGLEVSRGVKRSLSESGGARGPLRTVAEQGLEPGFTTGHKRQTLGTSSWLGGLGSAWDVVGGNPNQVTTGGFGITGLEAPGAGRSPWFGAVTGRAQGNPGSGMGASGASRTGVSRRNPFRESEERSLAMIPRVGERSSRSASGAGRRRAAARELESEEEESELGLVTALELGRHLTNAGGASQTRPLRIDGGETGGSRETGNPGGTGRTGLVGGAVGGTRSERETGGGEEEESAPRRRRSGRAWWEAAFAANLQDSKAAKDDE